MNNFIFVSYYLDNSNFTKYIVFNSNDEFDCWESCAEDFGINIYINFVRVIWYKDLLSCKEFF